MEPRVSARRPHASYKGDPDDKEISDDDDDDRNHKHHRRDYLRCQSLEDEVTEHIFRKPYRRGSKPFQNGHLCEETDSQSNETRKRYSFNPLEKHISVKFDQKAPQSTQFYRGPSDLNPKSRVNQPFSFNPGARDPSQWSPYEASFSSVDVASQIVQQGSVNHSLFAGRGLATVSNSHSQSWSSFGLVPGIPNGGLDFGLLGGTFRPAINSSLNMGLARQQCRDFEEKGFCLRGDMCPMEHGMNHIVIEDVQSLSQFDLPVSLASGNLSIAPVGTKSTPATSVVTDTLSNRKGLHGKTIKHGIGDIDSAAADFYDPDQPLWSNDSHTSTGLQSTSQPNVGKTDSLLDHDSSDDHHVDRSDGSDNELVKTRSSVLDRITSIKKRKKMGANIISKASPSNLMQKETASNHSGSSLEVQTGNERMNHKPSQKAHSTLFVNGIPHQNNKRELLLSHFKKFGEVTQIYIPLNSERALVQFSKREAAEAALMAPDAVMGNRFIKLWWANRDVIPDIQTVRGHNKCLYPHGSKVSSLSSFASKRKDDFQSILHNSKSPHAPVSDSDHPNVVDGMKVTPPLQKKLESLELLKEELRKKQELLDQKRNEFRLKLDKLEKQAKGSKGQVARQQLDKKQNLGVSADSVKAAATLRGADHGAIIPPAQDEVAATSSKSVKPPGKQSYKANLAISLPESLRSKSSPLSLVNLGSSVVNNRFKLDNRSTGFKVVPPLPNGLADVPALKEHFSPYGELSNVLVDDPETSKVTAQIYFKTRHAAEKAFLGGKSWKGHNLQFVWLNCSNTTKDDVAKQTP